MRSGLGRATGVKSDACVSSCLEIPLSISSQTFQQVACSDYVLRAASDSRCGRASTYMRPSKHIPSARSSKLSEGRVLAQIRLTKPATIGSGLPTFVHYARPDQVLQQHCAKSSLSFPWQRGAERETRQRLPFRAGRSALFHFDRPQPVCRDRRFRTPKMLIFDVALFR